MEIEKLTKNDAKAFDARLNDLERVYSDNYYDELVKSGFIELTDSYNGKSWYIKTFKGQNFSFISEFEKHNLSKIDREIKVQEKERLEIGKLRNDFTLSKWQLKTFWWAFTFGIVGGVYAIISIIIALTEETTEQKIQRILESKLKSQQKIEQVSVAPINKKNATLKK